MTDDEWCPMDGDDPPVCDVCGKQHAPNGTMVGDVGGVPIIVDCNVPDDLEGVFV